MVASKSALTLSGEPFCGPQLHARLWHALLDLQAMWSCLAAGPWPDWAESGTGLLSPTKLLAGRPTVALYSDCSHSLPRTLRSRCIDAAAGMMV